MNAAISNALTGAAYAVAIAVIGFGTGNDEVGIIGAFAAIAHIAMAMAANGGL